MISAWRQRWSSYAPSTPADFPFGFVQLSTNDITNCTGMPALRWHQTYDMGFVPNEAMQVKHGLFFNVCFLIQFMNFFQGCIHGRGN